MSKRGKDSPDGPRTLTHIYRDFSRVATEKKDEVLSDIATCARERWFLLKLKAKFAGLP